MLGSSRKVRLPGAFFLAGFTGAEGIPVSLPGVSIEVNGERIAGDWEFIPVNTPVVVKVRGLEYWLRRD